MSEIKNIAGEFEINIYIRDAYEKRTLKCNFGAIERLETKLLGKSIAETLQDALSGRVYMSDVVSVIYAGLEANNDRRLTRAQVGDALYAGPDGTTEAITLYIEYLTYALKGGTDKKGLISGEDHGQKA